MSELMSSFPGGLFVDPLLTRAFADFLRARRAQLNASDLGLPARDRRVPGLRRQEFAELAGLSVEYYTKLEQGRAANPSSSVLGEIANVLGLDRTERTYLWRVAQLEGRSSEQPLTLPAPVQQLMHSLSGLMPTFVLTPSTDVVAWNTAGSAIFGGFKGGTQNVARGLFLDPAMKQLYGHWESVVREQVAWLRFDMITHAGDNRLISLIKDLLQSSTKFASLWKLQEVRRRSHGRRVIHHPDAGTLDMYYTALPLPADPRLTIITWSAPEGSTTAAGLQKLIAAAPDCAPVTHDGTVTDGLRPEAEENPPMPDA